MDRGVVMNRRDFLKKIGLGSVAAVVVPSVLLSEPLQGQHPWPTPDDAVTGWTIYGNGDIEFAKTKIRGS